MYLLSFALAFLISTPVLATDQASDRKLTDLAINDLGHILTTDRSDKSLRDRLHQRVTDHRQVTDLKLTDRKITDRRVHDRITDRAHDRRQHDWVSDKRHPSGGGPVIGVD